MNEQEQIRETMRALGKRKKTMSKKAIAQRKAAAKKSVEARRTRDAGTITGVQV